MGRRWSDAPKDILQVIAEKIDQHSDFLNFSSVCKLWRCVYMENRHHLPCKLPMRLCHPHQLAAPLLLRSHNEDEDTHEFMCLSDEKVYGGFFLPEATNKWICGSSWGWLVTVDIGGEEVYLLNPLTRAQIRLPPLGSFTEHSKQSNEDPIDFSYIRKAIISADPSTHPDNFVVVAITGYIRALSYCRVGDTKWTNIKKTPVLLEDIIYHEGRLYAMDQGGVVMAFDRFNPDAVGEIIVGGERETIENGEVSSMKYLVMSSGVLLKVVKLDHGWPLKTYKFNVYKLEEGESPIYTEVAHSTPAHGLQSRKRRVLIFHRWVKLESLGDQMLLLGINSSMSLPAHLFPNFKGSCIYFTDDHVVEHYVNIYDRGIDDDVLKYYLNIYERADEVEHDTGIFDMHDQTIQSYSLNGSSFLVPSLWVIPNIW